MGYPTSMLLEVCFILFMATHSCISKWICTLCCHDCNKTSQTAPHHRRGSKQVEVLSGCFTSLSLSFLSLTRMQAGAESLGGKSLLYGTPVKLWESTYEIEWKLLFLAIWLSYITELKSLFSQQWLITLERWAKQSDVTPECITSSSTEGHALLFRASHIGVYVFVFQFVIHTSRCTRVCKQCIHLEYSE